MGVQGCVCLSVLGLPTGDCAGPVSNSSAGAFNISFGSDTTLVSFATDEDTEIREE